ncbi:MAG: acyltransferase [Chitinophagales bacterium]|nr:acyltransferase [Chitinophagales bacterium]
MSSVAQYYQVLNKHWQQEQNDKGIFALLTFFFGIVQKAWNLCFTQLYLFNIQKGSGVYCNGRPSLNIKGQLTLGDKVRIWSNIYPSRISVFKGAAMSIGNGTFINGARISAKQSVQIGKHCTIAPEVLIMDSDFHDLHDHSKEGANAPIIIHDHVWIATRAIILKGITIGEHAVVATGAVVTKDVEPYALVGGNPAKVIKYLR